MRPMTNRNPSLTVIGRRGVSVEDDNLENYLLLLKRVFGYKTKVELERPKAGTTEYWKWYYHNFIKTNGERMERRAEYTRKWRTK